MNNIFGENGFVYRIINKMVDLLVLNVVYIFTCIPVITIGAANTALYTLTLKMCKNQEGYIVREYWKAFKCNWKKSTIVWLGFLTLFFVLGLDFWIISSGNIQNKEMAQVLLNAMFLLAFMVISYVFPLMAMFENTIKHYLKNSVIISMTRIGYTIVVTMINLIPLLLFMLGGDWLVMGLRVFLLVGWALTAYINSLLFAKVFERYKK